MNIDDIQDRARGQWPRILLALGASHSHLTGKHGPCPWCGGTDRFRFDNRDGQGTFFCNQCGAGNGMTFASRLLQLEDARDLPRVAEAVARHIGVQVEEGTWAVPESAKSPSTGGTSPANRRNAMRVWEESIPDSGPVSAYLAGRAIVVPVDSDNIRYNQKINAMVALVRSVFGEPTAIHRTFLGAGVPQDRRKMMLGPVKNCAVHLAEPTNGILAIGEGIETCLSFQQSTGIPVWAGMTDGGVRDFVLPKDVHRLYILADVDEETNVRGVMRRPGQEAARRTAQRVANMGVAVSIVWPGDPKGPKVDFNDLLNADPSGQSIRDALARAEPVQSNLPQPTDDSPDKPVIQIIGGNLPGIIQQSEAALLSVRNNEIFQRAGSIVRVVKLPKTEVKRHGPTIRRDEGSLVILPVEQAWIELRLTECAIFEKWDGRRGAWAQVDCPANVSRALLANSGGWRFNALAGVIETPTLRPDGSILARRGYDEQTGLYLDTGGVEYPPIKEHPSQEEAIAALRFLESTIEEFPFLKPHHKSAALAAILTALVRRSLRTAPMFVFTAPKMGSGKGLLANVVSLIATGRTAPAITHSKDSEEEKKSLFTILVSGDSIALIDNIENSLGSPALCSILSEETYQARVLGETREIVVPTSVTWLATGNNLTVRGDLTTRTILIRIDPEVERPEERRFNRDLKTWIPENRARLVCAGITILRAYTVAGRPSTGLPPYGRFEEWAIVVRDALVWCGLADPCLSRNEVEDSDPVRIELNHFLASWWASSATDVTTDEMIERARFMASPPGDWMIGGKQEPNPAFLNALIEIAGDAKGNINKRTLGWYLRKHRGRIEGGLMISVEQKKNRTGIELWSVRQAYADKSAGSQGHAGLFSYPMRENANHIHNAHTCASAHIGGENDPARLMNQQAVDGATYVEGTVQ